jgi:hypothetical protein
LNVLDRRPAILRKLRKADIEEVIVFNHDEAEFVFNYGVSSAL